jgi:hypothetical protein
MKTLFILTSVMVFLLLAGHNKVEAQKKPSPELWLAQFPGMNVVTIVI